MSGKRKTAVRRSRQAPRFWASRNVALICLLGSLAIAFAAFYGWRSAARTPRENELRRYAGVVQAVSYTSGRHEGGEPYFSVSGVRTKLSYARFYPNFDLALRCILPGASVEVGVDKEDGEDLWELRCGGASITDISAMKRARHENGRAALQVGTAFLAIVAFWVWLLASGRAV